MFLEKYLLSEKQNQEKRLLLASIYEFNQAMNEALQQLLEYDTNLFVYLNNLGSESYDQFWLTITNKKTWYPMYAVFVLMICFQLKKWKPITAFVITTALMVLFVDQTTSAFFKPVIGRLRPCHFDPLDNLFRLVQGYCGGKYSYFSGHSSNSFAVATYLGLILRKWKAVLPLFLVWASVVAYSRIYVGVHFPLDILTGAIWGSLFGFVFYQLLMFLRRKIN